MKNSPEIQAISFIIISLFFLCSVGSIPFTRTDGLGEEKVPEPQISEIHEYNKMTFNENWALNIQHGDSRTTFGARNITQGNETSVDYQLNIQYLIGEKRYLAQFTLFQYGIHFIARNETIQSDLANCAGFSLSRTPTRYNGTVPELDCTVSYKKVRIFPETHPNSAFDLALVHHVRANWNETDVKIEAQFNFRNTSLYTSDNGELSTGAPFTVELHYVMALMDATSTEHHYTITPTSFGNQSLNYDIKIKNGTPLTVTTLKMRNGFTTRNETGDKNLQGYSSIKYETTSQVTHGFPNLIYKDTMSIQSDPEITVFHDRVQSTDGGIGPNLGHVAVVVIIIGVCISIAVLIFMKHHRKKRTI